MANIWQECDFGQKTKTFQLYIILTVVIHYFEFQRNTILGSGAKAMPVQRFRSCLAAIVNVMISVATSNDHSARYVHALL